MPRPDLSKDEIDYLTLLGIILEAWERDKVELMDPTPQELLQELLDIHGLRQSNLVGPVFPTKGIASEIIHGKRRLTVDYIDRLATFFHVSPAVFFPTHRDGLLASEGECR